MTQIDDRVCEGGQEVEISLSRMKDELLEHLGSTQVCSKNVKTPVRKKANEEHAQPYNVPIRRHVQVNPRAQILEHVGSGSSQMFGVTF